MAELKKQADREEKISSEDYEQLLDKYQFSAKEITPGKIIKGRVIKATPTGILMDIGFKSEGVIPIEDFADLDIQKIKPGDEIETILERTDAKEGYLILSKKRADSLRALEHLEKAFATQAFVSGKITEKTKNGYTVNVGIDAFLPDSHADIKIVREPEKLVGQTFKFKVVKFDRKTENAVLSRKLFLQDEREKKKRRVFGRLVKGEKVKGQVRSMTSFGAFIDLGGVEGLLHISDMSWGKTGHPSDVLTAGQEIEVVVLDFNERDERISLGYKQLTEDPWKNIGEKYAAG
ncbi:MAG: rpsA 1, partial [Candidatus Aminicenantes bacterium]|nr:rpsA 1 [Candidatus Aminicenantes bacterium]